MAWHYRHVKSSRSSKSLREHIIFQRPEFMWNPKGRPFSNPYTGKLFDIPTEKPSGALIGPNVLDAITTEVRVLDKKRHTFFVIQKVEALFEDPAVIAAKKIESQEADKHNSKEEFLSPFKVRYSTAGRYMHRLPDHPFIKTVKRSSVSISKLTYALAVSIYGSPHAATKQVGSIASEVWRQDLERSLKLYELVWKHRETGIDKKEVPDELLPNATVSQIVENTVLREVCSYFKIDPDNVKRPRGQPRKHRSDESKSENSENSQSSDYIKLTIDSDTGKISAVLIRAISGFGQYTNLSSLTIEQLAGLMADLEEKGYDWDAQMLEAYLDSVDSDWREFINNNEDSGDFDSPAPADPYTILGVTRETEFKNITKAYRRLMSAVHPDRLGHSNYFAQLVNWAYEEIKLEFSDD